MISVLIPVYNNNIVQLVTDVKKQLENENIEYEIICMDDCSHQSTIDVNKAIDELQHVKLITTPKNRGSVLVRQSLGKLAQYQRLLYLDADVEIYHEDFIRKYLDTLQENHDVVFGGFSYKSTPPSNNNILRWRYGKAKEEIAASQRNKNPYKVVISANYLIKKSTFLEIYGSIDLQGYGYDNYFGALLKQNNIDVSHIDNEVLHNGIETSELYLTKSQSAIEGLIQIYKSGKAKKHSNSLLKSFIWVKKIGLQGLMSVIYDKLGHNMKSHLLSNNPSINILQLYKICYMCRRYQ